MSIVILSWNKVVADSLTTLSPQKNESPLTRTPGVGRKAIVSEGVAALYATLAVVTGALS